MVARPSKFQQLTRAAREGSQQAFQDLVNTYGPHVRRYVKRQISLEIQAKVDEDDLAQMVWASFFDHRSMIVQFEESNAMMAYLMGIASNKLKREVGKYYTEKRSLHRECVMDDPTPYAQFRRDNETPSQLAIQQEEVERVLNRLEARDQDIVRMWLDGNKYAEIGQFFGIDESTVGKVIRRAIQWSSETT